MFRCLLLVLMMASLPLLAQNALEGVVLDASGAAVANAKVTPLSVQGVPLESVVTDGQGKFRVEGAVRGTVVQVSAPGFDTQSFPSSGQERLEIRLRMAGASSSITVTADRGQALEVADSAAVAYSLGSAELDQHPGPTLGNRLERAPGVLVQQTSPAQVSPFLRGLTGYQVLNLVDGVRFNNATFRSGPNQYLAYLEPSQAERMEMVLGPTSSQYGSDALGGTLQVLTRSLQLSSGDRPEWHGKVLVSGFSADFSTQAGGELLFGTRKFALMVGGTHRQHQDLRAGGGTDSRNALRVYLGLNEDQIRDLLGNRLQDTAFRQGGAYTKLLLRPSATQSVSAWYHFSDLSNVRNYKDVWGGLGRIQSDLAPQRLNFLYARYEKVGLGILDSLSGTFSLNSQGDGTVRQNLRFTDRRITDRTRVDAYGYSLQAATHVTSRHVLLFGGEAYSEDIFANRAEFVPTTGQTLRTRPLYPNDSNNRTVAGFIQDSFDLLPERGRLRGSAGVRFTGVRYSTQADPTVGVAESEQTFSDVTFHAGLSYRLNSWLSLHGTAARGFRAPNANDLGAVGLNDLGYEVPSADAVAANALLANNAGEGALSTGRSIGELSPERLYNYDFGVQIRQGQRLVLRTQGFWSDLYDPIVRRTLLFPANSVPTQLGGIAVQPITQTAGQASQGVVTVATALDARAVKAFVNDGRSRYYGVDVQGEYRANARWQFAGHYSYILGRDLNPNRNIRRLPPSTGSFTVRYAMRRLVSEVYVIAHSAQDRLSGGDIDDERIGASRARSGIASVFNSSRLSEYVRNGVFLPTGETLLQMQNRVLPLGQTINGVLISGDGTRVPAYLSTAGWATLNLRFTVPLAERLSAFGGVSNLLDRNYRVHGSGADAPGVGVTVGLDWRF